MSPKAGPKRAARPAAASAEPSREDQLARILRSETFQQADRLKRFLTFVVEEALAGRQADLKEYVIGVQVFRKEETFDPRTDPIVRVQARRLRAKLARYYREEGRTDPFIIDLPKGGYVPVFRSRETLALFSRGPSGSLAGRNTILVEPFLDHTGSAEFLPFGEALRDELVHQLTQVRELRVLVARDRREQGEGPARAASVVVAGSVRRAGDRVRVNVHLVDAVTDSYVWSEAIDLGRHDAFESQERIAGLVVDALEVERRSSGGPANMSASIVNLAAQNLYVQGRYHLNQRTEEGLRKAVDFFEKALVEGADFAPAHSGLADAYTLLTHYGVQAPADTWSKAASHATRAVTLDEHSAEAHTSLAHVKATQEFDWIGAEHEFRRAIGLDPRYATAHHWYAASCLVPLGRLDEARDQIVTALSLDPVSSIVNRDLAVVHYYRRDFEMALEQCDHTIELNPHFAPAYYMLGVIQEQRHEFDESAAAFQRAVHLSPLSPRMHGALGRAFALKGRKAQARQVLKNLAVLARQRYVSPVEFAWIHFALGDVDEGFRWLAKACDDRAFELIAIKVDPRCDPYREDPRARSLVARMGLG